MNTEFYTFGEILWDCLPSGRHAGGAPFNVAAHLVQLGGSASLISAIGQDPLGDEILKVAEDKGVNTQFVTRARIGLPTGTVLVTVDANGNATYELVQPVAWDEIRVLPETLEAVAQARALIFGSLAGRSPYNLDQLNRLLAIEGPMKFFDVNLRPPFADPALVVDIAKRADVIKLNDDEVGKLASWLRTGEATLNTPRSPEALAEACAALAKATNTSRICVTRAAEGAALWESGNLVCAPAPKVVIKDTVGAGVATGHSVSQADTGSQNEHDQKNPTNKGSGRGLTLSVAQSHNTENGRGDRIRTRRRAMITRNLQRETHKETHKARARRLILN